MSTTNSDQNEEFVPDSPYTKYSKYIQKRHGDDEVQTGAGNESDHPPPFDIIDENEVVAAIDHKKSHRRPRIKRKRKKKGSIAGSAISICSTDESENENEDVDRVTIDDK